MKINCITVDDEPPALAQMEDYISRVPFLNLMSSFDNAFDTLEYLKNNTVDLVFLDIEMEGLTGIQLLRVLKNKPKVVLTTAYDQYALKAFDLDVSDYLLKPIAFERFLQSVDKIFEMLKDRNVSQTPGVILEPTRNYIFVKTEYRMQRIDFKDITYIEGLKEYLIIHLVNDKKVLTLMSFKKMEEMLPSANFPRVHKSYMVALDKIESIERNRIRLAGKFIPVGESYNKSFYSLLENKKLL